MEIPSKQVAYESDRILWYDNKSLVFVPVSLHRTPKILGWHLLNNTVFSMLMR